MAKCPNALAVQNVRDIAYGVIRFVGSEILCIEEKEHLRTMATFFRGKRRSKSGQRRGFPDLGNLSADEIDWRIGKRKFIDVSVPDWPHTGTEQINKFHVRRRKHGLASAWSKRPDHASEASIGTFPLREIRLSVS
jgi:hypothetical protein